MSDTVEIEAPSHIVWAILTDFEHYRDWNPFMIDSKCNSAAPKVGAILTNTLKPPNASGTMVFKPEILTFEAEKELRWLGRVGCGGIFDGEHYFRLEKTTATRTRFVQGEIFSGCVIVSCICCLGCLFMNNTMLGFRAMNAALKARAEEQHKATPPPV